MRDSFVEVSGIKREQLQPLEAENEGVGVEAAGVDTLRSARARTRSRAPLRPRGCEVRIFGVDPTPA